MVHISDLLGPGWSHVLEICVQKHGSLHAVPKFLDFKASQRFLINHLAKEALETYIEKSCAQQARSKMTQNTSSDSVAPAAQDLEMQEKTMQASGREADASSQDAASDIPSDHEGVKQVESITLQWSKKMLWTTFGL
jgi:hypothetical protein